MTTFLILLLVLFAWSLSADRLARWSVTAPLAFAIGGAILTRGADPAVRVELDAHGLQRGTELVLAVLLFLDATESKDYKLGRTVGEWRLLGIALPLSVGLATLFGAVLFPGTSWWLLVLAALVVMPIDLAPISALLGEDRIPLRVRTALNLEAGLNDGLISPVFVFCLANLTSLGDSSLAAMFWGVVKGSVLALIMGAGLGFAAGWLVRRAHAAGWATATSLRLACLALPFVTYVATVLIGGNGFVAAFVAGLFYSPAARAIGEDNLHLLRDAGQLMAFAVWFVLGALTADEAEAGHLSWAVVGYAVLALTVARFLPVVGSLMGLSLTWPERAAVGWLGSRGVTSIVFAVLAGTQLAPGQGAFIINVMCVTVLLSALLHGLSIGPVARLFQRPAARRGADRSTRAAV